MNRVAAKTSISQINALNHTEVHPQNIPLAARMRPRTLDEFIGQSHIVGPGRLLRRAIQADQLSSVIFSGPPGTGKTTLAQIIANTTKSKFIAINAVLAGIADIRLAITEAKRVREEEGLSTILFIDEVHRFNKAQQDALLPHVESGALLLIGATTENPYFEVNKALVSRSRIFQLRPLEVTDILQALTAALQDKERGYGNLQVEADAEALAHIVAVAGGDARSALNALQLAVETTAPNVQGIIHLNLSVAEESIQKRAVLYDKDGDAHYDTISAFIKAVRGSDPDAALYWMAKMLYAGEEPRYIFRRMLILASEDVGLADPQALSVVHSAAQAFEYVGLPEGQYHLSQACLYLSTAPKSNSTMAFFDALNKVQTELKDEIPDPLRDKSRDGDDFGHGQGYQYPHAYRDHWVAQQYLPASLQGKVFYEPSDSGYEATIQELVITRREAQLAALQDTNDDESSRDIVSGLKNNWLNRAIGQSSDVLRKLRRDIFVQAKVGRESLVLDISGGTGFLTWEACRVCHAGGIWTRCTEVKEKQAMEEWAMHLGVLNRPQVFLSALADLPSNLQKQAEVLLFDGIMGWDSLAKVDQPAGWLQEMLKLLNPQGVLVLAEKSIIRQPLLSELFAAQKLQQSAFASLLEWENKFRENIAAKELTWTHYLPTLSISNIQVNKLERNYTAMRKVSAQDLQNWFALGQQKPDSLFAYLQKKYSESEYLQLQAWLLQNLSQNEIPWKNSYDIWVFGSKT